MLAPAQALYAREAMPCRSADCRLTTTPTSSRKILRGEIPCKKVYEDEWALAFHDINPQAPTHVLVMPKGPYCSFADFSAKASDAEIAGFMRAVGKVAKDLGLEAPGYRLLFNMGVHSGQEVPHFHVAPVRRPSAGTDAAVAQ